MKVEIYKEPCYDLDELTNNNLHVHTFYSGCARPEMTAAAIIKEAERCGLKIIALTDHFGDEKSPILEQNEALRAEVEKTGTAVKVIYGAELSGYGIGKYTDTDEENAGLDYRLYSCNHYHCDFWEHPEDKSARSYALHGLAVVSSIIKSGRADAIAHPLIGRFLPFADKKVVTNSIKDNELGDLLTLARDYNVAWEINRGAALGFPEFARKTWDIGREVGVIFHFGMDSHNLMAMDSKSVLSDIKKILK